MIISSQILELLDTQKVPFVIIMIWIKTNGFKTSLVQKTHPTNAIAILLGLYERLTLRHAIPYVFTSYSFPFPPLFLSPSPFSSFSPFFQNVHQTACRMGHSVKASLWYDCDSLSINTRFRFLYFRIINCKSNMRLH